MYASDDLQLQLTLNVLTSPVFVASSHVQLYTFSLRFIIVAAKFGRQTEFIEAFPVADYTSFAFFLVTISYYSSFSFSFQRDCYSPFENKKTFDNDHEFVLFILS